MSYNLMTPSINKKKELKSKYALATCVPILKSPHVDGDLQESDGKLSTIRRVASADYFKTK